MLHALFSHKDWTGSHYSNYATDWTVLGSNSCKRFSSSPKFPTGDEVHAASFGYLGVFPRGKVAGAYSTLLNSSSAKFRMKRATAPLPLYAFTAGTQQALHLQEKNIVQHCG